MINKKPRIAVIGLKGLPAFGGAAAVGENIINELNEEYEFTVYSTASHTIHKTGNLGGFRQVVFRKLPFKRINTLYYYIISALHALFSFNYDLVHLHHRDAAFIIPLLRLRYKVLVTTHSCFYVVDKWKRYEFFFQINERFFIKFANAVTSVSLNEKRKFKKEINLDVTYIPNGINLLGSDVIRDVNYKNYIFFGAGRIIRTKGLDALLRSLNKINYKGLLVVAGDLDQNEEYKQDILELSKDLNVVFLGLIKDKKELLSYIANSDFFVYPSYLEAMSMMLLEGASVKAPIICSDIIENKDIFSDDEVLFFESNSVDDLAEKVLYASKNLDEMKLRSERAYKKLITSYNWQLISEKYSEAYKSLLYHG